MAMNANNMANEVLTALQAVSLTPSNTYTQRLWVAITTAIIDHMKNHAEITVQEVYVGSVGDKGGTLAAPLGVVAGTIKPEGTIK